MQIVLDPSAPIDREQVGAHGQAADRIPLAADPHARTGSLRGPAIAALAAGEQGKLWNFVETFYDEQGEEGSGYVTEGFIKQGARQVPGLDLTRWASERANSALAGQVVSDAQAASASGLGGTPAFLIGVSGGQMSRLEPTSFTDSSSFDQAIARLVHSAAQR